jgi:hypothetical protein
MFDMRPLLPKNQTILAVLLALTLIRAATVHAQVLYNGALGSLPENQGWSFLATGGTEKLTNNSAFLDTTASTSYHAGWSIIPPLDFNRTNGFTILFNAAVNAETHISNDRAGFSIIVICDDEHGIELGFWTNTIFAQSDSPLFTHAEQAVLPTTNLYMDYALDFFPTNYILRANGTNVLTGPIRNYTAANTFPYPNPYVVPDLLFLGDDTGSAGASLNLQSVVFLAAPTVAMTSPGVLAWTGVSNQTYQVQASTNLVGWTNVGAATSTSNLFYFTNSANQPAQYFRVALP